MLGGGGVAAAAAAAATVVESRRRKRRRIFFSGGAAAVGEARDVGSGVLAQRRSAGSKCSSSSQIPPATVWATAVASDPHPRAINAALGSFFSYYLFHIQARRPRNRTATLSDGHERGWLQCAVQYDGRC